MKLIRRHDPFTVLSQLNDLWDEDFLSIDWEENQMDVFEEGDNIIVKLKAPDFDKDSFDISIQDNTLTIEGRIKKEEKEKDKKRRYFRREIRSRSFTRSITLPKKVNAEKAEAKFSKGILRLTLPKEKEARLKKIAITTK